MPARPAADTRAADLRALHRAARIAHGWDPADPPRLGRLERMLIVAGALVAVFGGWVLLVVLFVLGGPR